MRIREKGDDREYEFLSEEKERKSPKWLSMSNCRLNHNWDESSLELTFRSHWTKGGSKRIKASKLSEKQSSKSQKEWTNGRLGNVHLFRSHLCTQISQEGWKSKMLPNGKVREKLSQVWKFALIGSFHFSPDQHGYSEEVTKTCNGICKGLAWETDQSEFVEMILWVPSSLDWKDLSKWSNGTDSD